ncbi:MAG: DUF2892 domain-containing protein, partial [Chloroflexaceae bacterium]|nr:DUF2892 domain-containing protein [Chloroflexaceae bacterium]
MVMQEVAVPITNRPGPAPTHARKDPAEVNVGDTERLVSVLGAGLLAAYGLRHMPLGLGLVLLGGALAYRGVSGHCAV